MKEEGLVKEHDHPKREYILEKWMEWMGLDLTEERKQFYGSYSYKELVRPFVIQDRNHSQKRSIPRLAIKYQLSIQEIKTILKK